MRGRETARQSRAKVGSMTKEESALETTAPLPPEKLLICCDSHKHEWWAEHRVPVRYEVGPKAGQIGWAVAASWPLEAPDEASAFADACHDLKINPESGISASGMKFEIFINGEKRGKGTVTCDV